MTPLRTSPADREPDPALLELVRALARDQARRDHAADLAAREQRATQPTRNRRVRGNEARPVDGSPASGP